jgi:hypothetical protein
MALRISLSRIALFILVIAVSVTAFALPVATARGTGSQIEWQVAVANYDRVQLTVVTADGESFTREFKAGQPLSFRLQDLSGAAADGDYRYELRVVPKISAETQSKLKAARSSDDSAAVKRIMSEAGLSAEALVQSGSFHVQAGSIMPLDTPEGNGGGTRKITTNARGLTPVVNDQVIADDLIVQGSACVGLDCVNGESFGFDTIRLKENNTRIKFDDTSTTSGCPANDWQLTANDACGGASKFSIEDITGAKVPFTITAGAATNSIFVDSTGRLGLRTSAPVLDIHVATSNTPAIRLEQNSSGGFTAQTWDVAGNEANFFVRDVTGGSRLPFRIRPGAPTSSIDVSASGSVGINTASPEAKLHVFGASNADTFVGIGNDPDGSTGTESSLNIGYSGASFGIGSGFFNVRPDSSAVAPNPSLRFATGNTVRMIIDNEGFIALGDSASSGSNPTSPIQYTNGAVTARLTAAGVWQDNSSRKAKENIRSLTADAAFKALEVLEPVEYNYKVMPNDPKVGFIAEDVPELVAAPEREGLSALDIVAVVTKVVKEQQKTIDTLNHRIDELEKAQKQQ